MPGGLATLGAVSSILLTAGIAASGNFGHFNAIMIVVVISWFDHATARELALANLATPVGVLFCIHTFVCAIGLAFNTFASFAWTLWPAWRRLRARFRWPVALARLLVSFRVAHPYGVFPPASPPAPCPYTIRAFGSSSKTFRGGEGVICHDHDGPMVRVQRRS